MRFQAASWLRAHSALRSLSNREWRCLSRKSQICLCDYSGFRPPGSEVRALACQRAAAQMSSTSLTGSLLSCARSGPARRQHG